MTRALLLVILCVLPISLQRSTPEDDSYVAAVVEYQVQSNASLNLENYVTFIQDASNQDADVIVFPELTLSVDRSVVVPIFDELVQYPVPALNPELFDEVLVTISSAARQNAIYVVINLEELVNCTVATNETCPEEKVYLFNTNVVFDREGAIIDRYRKIHLFGEFTRTPALEPELGIFDTDFGVTFGHFICFDLMFQVPAIQLVDKHSLNNIIFSTMWFSEMPYLTAVQIQEAYAYSMNVNFLASGANNVRVGSAGSGIFSGKAGALVSIMPGVPTTRLLVARVPKVPGEVNVTSSGPIYNTPSEQDGLILISDPSLSAHASTLLSPGFQIVTLQDSNIICTFTVNLGQRNNNTYYRYRVAAFGGVRSFSGLATGGTRLCSLFACTDDTIESCGQRYPEYVEDAVAVFQFLSITAYVTPPGIDADLETRDSVYFPVSMDTRLMPLNPESYFYTSRSILNLLIEHTYTLTNFNTDLYSFGIWGRVFATDGQEASPPLPEQTPEPEDTATTPADTGYPGTAVSHNINILLIFLSLSYLLRQIVN